MECSKDIGKPERSTCLMTFLYFSPFCAIMLFDEHDFVLYFYFFFLGWRCPGCCFIKANLEFDFEILSVDFSLTHWFRLWQWQERTCCSTSKSCFESGSFYTDARESLALVEVGERPCGFECNTELGRHFPGHFVSFAFVWFWWFLHLCVHFRWVGTDKLGAFVKHE